MAEFHITTCDGGRGGCFQPACKCPCHDGRTNPRGGEAGRSRSDGSQPSNHVEGTGVATRRHPDHLCTVEEARSWANMFGSDTKFGRMALTVIALADEIEELHRGQQLRDELTEALCITTADCVDAWSDNDE